MAVVFDAQSNADITGTTITSFSSNTTLTVGTGANRALLLAVQWSNSTPPAGVSITWDGQALTLIPNTSIGNGSAGNCALYGLLNPNSGTKTLAGSWSTSTDFYCGAATYTGVDQTSIAVAFPNGTTATGAATPATVTQSSTTSDAAVGSIVTNTTLGPVTSGTQIYLDNTQPLISGAGIRGAGAATVTFTATTGGGWAASSCDILASGGSSVQPRAPHITKLPPFPFIPPPQSSYNAALYTVTVILPFNQTDWSNTYRAPDWAPQPQIGVNPNLFINPIPFNQTDWSKPFNVLHVPFDLSVPLNPNIFTNPIPILNVQGLITGWGVADLPVPQQPYNQSLYTVTVIGTPFNQTYWPPSIRVPNAPVDFYNLIPYSILTLPFNQIDWSKPFTVPRAAPDQTVSLNPNIFTNPYPVLNIDTSRPARLTSLLQVDAPYNQTLYTVVITGTPFNQTYWPLPIKVPSAPVDFYNLVLYDVVTLPFNQIDWSKPFIVPRAPFDQSVPLNPNLFTNPIPFLATDRLPAFKVPLTLPQPSPPLNINLFTNPYPILNIDSAIVPPRRATVLVDQTYNQSLYTITVTAPFYAAEILFLRKPVSSPLPDPPLNINLFTNPIPIFNYGSIPVRTRGFVDTSQPYNTNLYGVVTVQVPFNQVDWSRPFVPRPAPTQDLALNINLFTNPIPFSQYDWRKPFGVPHAPFDLSVQTNPNLFKNLFPFNQYQYPTQQPVKLGPPHVPPYNQNLYTATLGSTTLHIVKFIGNVGHFMIR